MTLIEPSVNETVPVPRSDCVPLKFRRPPLSMWTVPPERVRPLPMMLSESFESNLIVPVSVTSCSLVVSV